MIELIANTGIQYIDIPVTLREDEGLSFSKAFADDIHIDEQGEKSGSLLFPYFWEEYEKYIDSETLNVEAVDAQGNIDPDRIKPDFVNEINEDSIYKVRAREALDVYAGHWLPIPYFREKNSISQPYHPGPNNWARMWLGEADLNQKRKHSCTHMLVLAFDTATTEKGDNGYGQLHHEDATNSGDNRFSCVRKERFYHKFYTDEVFYQWLEKICSNKQLGKKGEFRQYANYFVLLEMLHGISVFPEVSLIDSQDTIDTSLVIDIGNSRTSALIVETTNPKGEVFDFTKAAKLELRDLSIPSKIYTDAFEMQLAFSQEKFGSSVSDLIDGDLFSWPSLVRVGPEAVRLTSVFESENSNATLSSPKRYLWDKRASFIPWQQITQDGDKDALGRDTKKLALYGISENLTSEGKVIKNENHQNHFEALQSSYSRSSLMTFSVFEIISQVMLQINSVAFRKNNGNSSFKRKLKNIVFTSPTAMTNQEHNVLHKAIEDAMFLIKKYYHEDLIAEQIKIHPGTLSKGLDIEEEKQWKYDEATCSQITYLYSELVDKFKGDHDLFFKYKGRSRINQNGNSEDSITIASVDIGGGTTDLMICNYSNEGEAEIPFITPKPMFWEGFNLAGDDIVKSIIEYVVLPEIEKNIKVSGGERVEETMNLLFGEDVGAQNATDRIYRKQFASQIATFCAYYALDSVKDGKTQTQRATIGGILQKYILPKNNLIPYLENVIEQNCSIEKVNLLDFQIELDGERINRAIQNVVGEVIENLSKVIASFDCDVVLISGKSSNLRIIQDLFVQSFVVSPDRIVNFSNYRFGKWYPFANALGDVNDPKTTVVVGALISFLSSINKLSNFNIDIKALGEVSSTADYIGVLNDNLPVIAAQKVIFENGLSEGAFSYYGAPIRIGMRQLPLEEWIATPLYTFDFKNDEQRVRLAESEYELPYTVKLTRDLDFKDELVVDDIEVVDKNGEEINARGVFKLDFITLLKPNGYWRDTGEFLINTTVRDEN